MGIWWIKDLLKQCKKMGLPKTSMQYIYGIVYRAGIKKEDSLIKGSNGTYKILRPSFRYWYADPIIFWEDGKGYPDVYMEVMDQLTGRGFIGISSFDNEGALSKPKPIIKEKFHLSFPHVFSHKGRLYMIPETSGVHSIRIYLKDSNVWKLYREFPIKGEKNANIVVDICSWQIAEDSFLLIAGENIKGKKTKTIFYLLENLSNEDLCNIKRLNINDDNEYLKTERNAGALIKLPDGLYRAKQISGKNYGEGISLYQVIAISCNEYVEKYIKDIEVADLKYDWPIKKDEVLVGAHTYGYVMDKNSELGYEVLDVAKKAHTFIGDITSFKSSLYKLIIRK